MTLLTVLSVGSPVAIAVGALIGFVLGRGHYRLRCPETSAATSCACRCGHCRRGHLATRPAGAS